MSALSSARYSGCRARTCASKAAKGSGTRRTIALIRDGREARLALAELAPWRVRGDLDPALLAEVVDDAVGVLEGLALVHLCPRDHVDAIAAVLREGGPRTVRALERDQRERERDDAQEDDRPAH